MDTQEKKKILIENTTELVNAATKYMLETIEAACNCGAIDIDSYDGSYRLPKTILVALLTDEKDQYSLTKEERKEAENIYYFI